PTSEGIGERALGGDLRVDGRARVRRSLGGGARVRLRCGGGVRLERDLGGRLDVARDPRRGRVVRERERERGALIGSRDDNGVLTGPDVERAAESEFWPAADEGP